MDLLRINTAGSVDDGKSTLIGRLMYDSHALTVEQEELVRKKTAEKGLADLDFSVITDGLIAEREQGITIDVAHIYFSTPERKFIIADSPGHVEYTRNMVTGASNSDVSIILIDARKGLLEQTHRHYFISRLLRLQNVVFCINKMDLISYSQTEFEAISLQIQSMVNSFPPQDQQIAIIPISSLKGDNVVAQSVNMPWYTSESLSQLLHTIDIKKSVDPTFLMDIQNVQHVQNEEFVDYRAYAGRVISGHINLGDELFVLPSRKSSKITEIRQFTDCLDSASEGQSIQIRLSDNIDISRGMMFVSQIKTPLLDTSLHATLVWFNETPALLGGRYLAQAGARTAQCKLQSITAIIPPERPDELQVANEVKLNEIAKVTVKLATPLFLDTYSNNRHNGAFILIDLQTNNTVAVGFVE